ncbi:RHS repeat domain-containing protein [Criblamydia sequanensis]|uniref:Rhs family protein n=1 Tax=Candidatus Criblamydia sequanensis CRIB-18 TaxID=1437425 RepID=A0A090E3A9_9BACT|nr:RHS repeat-associated core domain-containing protein [Criblamydia sequanensis]CDR35089.1 Rhs family protein [Criblamydia sequanensis CRIB-18]
MLPFLVLILSCLTASLSCDLNKQGLLPSTAEEVNALESSDDFLIHGLISPLTGQLVLHETDLFLRGAQNLKLKRTYISPPAPAYLKQGSDEAYFFYEHILCTYRGWTYFPHLKLQAEIQKKESKINLATESGAILSFCLTSEGSFKLMGNTFGISNYNHEVPSGKNDVRNIQIKVEDNWKKILVMDPSGKTLLYTPSKLPPSSLIPLSLSYLLEKEILPNGKVIKYTYNPFSELVSVETKDPKERYTYACLNVNLNENTYSSLTGKSAVLQNEIRPLHVKNKSQGHKRSVSGHLSLLSSVTRSSGIQESLHYNPEFLLDRYLGQDTRFQVGFGKFSRGSFEKAHLRVKTLFLENEKREVWDPAYEMEYKIPTPGTMSGETIVKISDGTKIHYDFNANLLIRSIRHYDLNGHLRKEKKFYWNAINQLSALELREGDQLLYKKSFAYDSFGNPIRETIEGDLTGNSSCESLFIKREFSKDGRNLLLKEEKEEGLTESFEYLPNSNLPVAKIVSKNDRILLREFKEYDDCHNLIRVIEDDGASLDKNNLQDVKQRKIKKIILRQESPNLHLPEWVEETYLEENTEKLLSRKHLLYDEEGRVIKEEFYDAKGLFSYAIEREYNEKDELIKETNAIGQKAYYSYDDFGNPVFSSTFTGLQIENRYDANNRLIYKKETGRNGESRDYSYQYDAQGRLISKGDEFQNLTHYDYDLVVSKPNLIVKPAISTLEGNECQVVTRYTYDGLGRVLSLTNSRGLTKYYRYTAYGKPSEITHTNGYKERFTYTRQGNLSKHIDREGITTLYEYDELDRLLLKTISKDELILAQEKYEYDSKNLISEINREGHKKTYFYDGAGRKVREEFLDQVTTYAYDDLGELAEVIKDNGGQRQIIRYKRDFFGRITYQSKGDVSFFYTYDECGNISTIKKVKDEEAASETFTYDSFNRLIEKKDALGNITTSNYETVFNSLGQKVSTKRTLSPENVATVMTFDAHGRVVKKEIGSSSSQTKIYDGEGNLLLQTDLEHDLRFTYTSENEIESFTRGYGTSFERTTSFEYTPNNKLYSKNLPDGRTLYYSYTPLGDLESLLASDGSLHHRFEYNKTGKMVKAIDLVQNVTLERKLDGRDRVVFESLGNGLEIHKSYDSLERLSSLTIPNFGEITYEYDDFHLKKLSRKSNEGDCLYTHSLDSYSLRDQITSETLIGDLGKASYSYDLSGHLKTISNPYFLERCSYSQEGNLLNRNRDDQEIEYGYDELNQLTSENESITFFDAIYNKKAKNEIPCSVNPINELISQESTTCFYDLNGNLTLKETPWETYHYSYDILNRLTQVVTKHIRITYSYDPLGRCLSRKLEKAHYGNFEETDFENYLYEDETEIGAFSKEGICKNFRLVVPALKGPCHTLVVELDNKFYAALRDCQNNLIGLVDPITREPVFTNNYTAFGESNLVSPCPWGYASKRIDPETRLINFGKRHYAPDLGRWITVDPAGFIDSVNPYQFVFNNPFRYSDPDGQLVFIPIFTLAWGAGVTAGFVTAECIAGTLIGAALGYAAYESMSKLNEVSWLPKDPFNHPDWEDIGHPEAKAHGHHDFQNREDGRKIRYDEAKEGEPGHKGRDHYHWYNPKSEDDNENYYLNESGKPCKKDSHESHLYPPDEISDN